MLTTGGFRYLAVKQFRLLVPRPREGNDGVGLCPPNRSRTTLALIGFYWQRGEVGVAKESVRHNLIRVMRLQRSPIQSIIRPQPVHLVQFMLEGLLPVALVLLSM